MPLKSWNLAIVVVLAGLWLAGSTERGKPVVSDAHIGRINVVEARAAATPSDPESIRALAQAYLDARAPGMAISSIEHAPFAVRSDPTVDHLYARALLDQGRAVDALAAERRVLKACAAISPEPEVAACSDYLVASATRRADIVEQLVALGVEDANAHPEVSNVAYHNATRQVGLSVAR